MRAGSFQMPLLKPVGGVLGHNLGTTVAHSEELLSGCWQLSLPWSCQTPSSPAAGLAGAPGNPRWGSGTCRHNSILLPPASSDFLSASGSQAVTHSLHFLQSRLFPSWTNF